MKKCNVYTRTGDQGQTSLVGGKRISKASLRLESYGSVDELNSQIGLLLTYLTEPADRECLTKIQCQLFSIGNILATDPGSEKPSKCQITEGDIIDLEHCIDLANENLPGWRGFTLPGGCQAAALAHVCRTVCRRAERQIYALDAKEPVDKNVTAYMNRLSDYLYILACRLNFLNGTDEILWHKA
ncbi:MAG: cob(I)yrinic acid a,c-diamide adenosyltransferase [Bacteroidaceae bacterium]|nr:cob(I)yrinic acid a,c-diamide adenosyltransferase [Bacteroidaceae bacterium]